MENGNWKKGCGTSFQLPAHLRRGLLAILSKSIAILIAVLFAILHYLLPQINFDS